MNEKKPISRRDFLRVSLGGMLALGLGKYDLFSDENVMADSVFHGASVLTVNPSNGAMGAIAIKDNRILAMGKDLEDIKPFIGNQTRILKLPGGCVTPGMIDVHNHIIAQSTTTINWVNLMRCNGCASVRQTLAAWIIEHDWRPGCWVRGQGYMWLWDKVIAGRQEGLANVPLVDRFDLDQIVEIHGKKVDLSKYPIYLVQLSGHYATLNALAMIKAKVMSDSGSFYAGPEKQCVTYPAKSIGEAFSPEGHAFGSFFSVSSRGGFRGLDGMIFHHYAMEEFLIRAMKYSDFPRLNENEMYQALRENCRRFIRMGVTSIYDNNLRGLSLFPAVRNFPANTPPEDKLRISLHPYICHLNQGAFPAFDSGNRKGVTSQAPLFDGDWMRLIGYKLQIDAGAMTGFTWDPSRSAGDMTKGKLNLWEYRDYLEIVRALENMGAQISIHVAGDKALDWTLDAYEAAGVGGKDRRHRIEHLICVPQKTVNSLKNSKQSLFQRAKDLDMVFCPQPGFILAYANFYDHAFGPGLGQKKENAIYPRLTHSIPYRSALENGITVALSSDNPCVLNPSPLVALWEAVHRRTRQIGKGRNVFLESYVYNHPDENGNIFDERVDFTQALRGHTIDAAFCGFEEKKKGSLEPGKLADLVVWNKDIRMLGERISITQVDNFQPSLTMIDGCIVYQDSASGIITEKG
ncbi:amidohydrolase family protein [Candidatus Sumerlaeota bacterium]|nr:amidohydrolase family protein [Candidatus Sumerlaeota bacterium]